MQNYLLQHQHTHRSTHQHTRPKNRVSRGRRMNNIKNNTNDHNNMKKRGKNNGFFKLTKTKGVIVVILFIFLGLGFQGFPLFSEYRVTGTTFAGLPASWLVAPLGILKDLPSQLGGFFGFFLPLAIYYYLLSCVLVWTYRKLKK